MKKIISLVLCAVMLIGAMSMLAFADDDLAYIDARDLRAFGQKHYYVGDPDETAPEIDGVIIPGEYSLSVETHLDEDYVGPEFGTGERVASGEVTYYFSYNDDYLFIGAEVVDEDCVCYGTWDSNPLRADQIGFKIGGIKDTGSTETLKAEFQNQFFPSSTDEDVPPRSVDADHNSMDVWTGADGLMDYTILFEDYTVKYDDTRKVITYELQYKRAGFLEYWADVSAWDLRNDIFSLNFMVQDTTSVVQEGTDQGTRAGVWTWGTVVDPDNSPYKLLSDYWFCSGEVKSNGASMGGPGVVIIPAMLFLGHEEDFVDVLNGSSMYEDEETEPTETEPTETEPTEPTETEPTETEPTETEPTATEPTDTTDKADDAKEGGCGSSIAAMGIALIATLGTAVTVVAKKKD